MTKLKMLLANKTYDTDKQIVEKGQIILLEGYDGGNYVVYDIKKGCYGLSYKLINLRTYDFEQCDMICPISEKFGIGFYYDAENPKFKTEEELADLKDKANKKQSEKNKAEKNAEVHRKELEAIGRERLKAIVPADTKAVIIAENHQNESDITTDYYAYATNRTVILGFSTHTKDLFSEMRKYAANLQETAYLAEKNEDYENREKYSMGAGYYLGESKYHGWIIKKVPFYDLESFINTYALVAGEEKNICVPVNSANSGIEKTVPKIISGNFIITEYSEKSVAIFGDTKPIKDKLLSIGGRYNKYLNHNGQKRNGWVFPKSKEVELRKLIATEI